jgi:hypothetical protein
MRQMAVALQLQTHRSRKRTVPLSQDPEKRRRQLANLRPAPPAPPLANVRTLRHGGTARKATLVAAGSWAERIMTELEAEAPLRDAQGGLPVHDRQAVELLASALARLQSVSAWLDLRPAVDEQGRPWPAEDTAHRLRREVARLLDALGMTPSSRLALGLDLVRTVDLAQQWAAEADGDVIDGGAQ